MGVQHIDITFFQLCGNLVTKYWHFCNESFSRKMIFPKINVMNPHIGFSFNGGGEPTAPRMGVGVNSNTGAGKCPAQLT